MKRFISLLTLGVLLASNFVFSVNAASTYSGVTHSNAVADAVVYQSTSGTTYEKTTDAGDTGTNDVIVGQNSGEMLYVGFDEKFDGVSYDIGTTATGGAYITEYWNGSTWATLVGSNTANIENSGSGVYSIEWTRPSDWAKTSVNMGLAEDGSFNKSSGSLYFMRTRITTNYGARAYADQLDVINYNMVFDVENQLGTDVTVSSSNFTLSSSGDNTVYAAKYVNGNLYGLALNTPSATTYNYTLNVSGYVQEAGSVSMTEAVNVTNETLSYAQVVKAYDEDGSQVTISSVSAGSYSCTVYGKTAYCPIPASADAMNVTVYASGYDASTITLYNRSLDTDAQAVNSVTMSNGTDPSSDDYDLDVKSMEWQDDGDLVVSLRNLGSDDVDEDENVYVAIYVDGDREYYDDYSNTSSSSFLNAGVTQSINFGDDLLDTDEDSYEVEVCVDKTDTVDESDEDNNCYEKTLTQGDDTDGVDLEVDDMYMDDEDLIVEVVNSGDEDVSSSKSVKLYVYVDGDLEYSQTIDDTDEDGDFFNAGDSSKINVGDNLFDDHGSSYDVEACIDYGDNVDETDEDNNCRTEDEEDLDNGDDDYTCSDFNDVNDHWAEEYICDLFDLDIVDGYSHYTFGPDQDISRAEFLKIALLAAGEDVEGDSDGDEYSDVKSSDWFYDYVTYATEEGYVEGYSNGKFMPNDDISRAEAVIILMRIAGYEEEDYDDFDTSDINFSDVERNDWFTWAIILADDKDIVDGYGDDTFRPYNDLSRGEAAKIVDLAMDELF